MRHAVDEFGCLNQPVGQQLLLHGLDARRRIDFAGQHYAGLHRAVLVVGQFTRNC